MSIIQYLIHGMIYIDSNNNTNYASIVYGGELYIISGFENGESSKKIYKYNTQSETWSYITSIKR